MKSLRVLIFDIFVAIVIITTLSLYLRHEIKTQKDQLTTIHARNVTTSPYQGTANLQTITGESLIGMVPHALEGEYELVIDGLLININTDITTINFRGVPKHMYKLDISRQSGAVQRITAIRI